MTTQIQFLVLNGVGQEALVQADLNIVEVGGVPTSVLTLHSVPELNGEPVSSSNPMPVQDMATVPAPVTAANPAASATGNVGTSVPAFAAGTIVGGGYITNPSNAPSNLYVDPVNAPAAASPGTNGTTTELFPGQTWSAPAGLTNAVRVASSDANHVFVAVRF